jgi:hypothetical protein
MPLPVRFALARVAEALAVPAFVLALLALAGVVSWAG